MNFSRILIVEDDLTTRTMLEAVTRSWGYDPLVVSDGLEAWELLNQSNPPKLLLLDWLMPGLDGIALTRKIRGKDDNNPAFIILLTSNKRTEEIVEALENGANEYIIKPFNHAELKARLKVGQRVLELQQQLNEAADALAHQAMFDELTSLMNRRGIMNELETHFQRCLRKKSVLSIGMCDIDYFKSVNDRYGHSVGDRVLTEVAHRMRAMLRPYDSAGRYGGEEFLVISESNAPEAMRLFERMRKAIEAQLIELPGGEQIQVTISCGVTVFDPSTESRLCDELLRDADRALYQAKDLGRNQTCLYRTDNS